jgi:hypothetical protein
MQNKPKNQKVRGLILLDTNILWKHKNTLIIEEEPLYIKYESIHSHFEIEPD